jgi:DNA end-binding protein Ku
MASRRTQKSKRAVSSAANETGASSQRALWTGTIGFGLVQFPVSLVPAEKSGELAFHQLDERDLSPIGYERVNKSTGEKVAWEHIVKGYEVTKGKYVVVTDEDFKHANVAATQSIDIEDFVGRDEIHPTYYERPYYLMPAKQGHKAYAVLRDALAEKNLVAVATVVIRTRQHLCAVLAEGNRLLLELLRFEHELRPMRDSVGREPKASAKEVALAGQLIDGMISRFDPKKYKDTYSDDLLKAIHEKAKTGKISVKQGDSRAEKATSTDLLTLLRDSVSAAKSGHRSVKSKPRHAKSKAA